MHTTLRTIRIPTPAVTKYIPKDFSELRILVGGFASTTKLRLGFLIQIRDHFQVRHRNLGIGIDCQHMSGESQVYDLRVSQ